MIKFTENTIYDTVGNMIYNSKKCKNMARPIGVKRYSSLCKLYDNNGTQIYENSCSNKKWITQLKANMHKIMEGQVEIICRPHPL